MKYYARIGETDHEIEVTERRDELWLELNGRSIRVDLVAGPSGGFLSLILNGVSYDITAEKLNGEYYVTVQGEAYTVAVEDERAHQLQAVADTRTHHQSGTVRSIMPGMMTQVLVRAGDAVEAGQALAIMEAMKMENEVRSPLSGTVAKVCITVGESVTAGQDLFVIE